MIKKEKAASPGKSKKAIPSRLSRHQKNEDGQLQQEVQTLMKKFLYEIYKQLRKKKLSRTEFASLLGISPSYLSQIFHSKKPLTFDMMVRCQQILQIEFEIKVMS